MKTMIDWHCLTCGQRGLARPEWGGMKDHHAKMSPSCKGRPQERTPEPLEHDWDTGALDLPNPYLDGIGILQFASDFTPLPDAPAETTPDPTPDYGGGDSGGAGASDDWA